MLSEEREARAAAEGESRKRMADTASADHCYCGLTDDQLDDKSSRTASPAFKVLRKAAALGPEIEPILVEVEVNTDITILPSTVTQSEGTSSSDFGKLKSELAAAKKQNASYEQELQQERQKRSFSADLIKDNDSKTRFYTRLPAYGVLVALLSLLTEKAERLQEWRGSKDTSTKPHHARNPWRNMLSIESQFFCVLARLRLDLHVEDICDRVTMSSSVFPRMFATWVIFQPREHVDIFTLKTRRFSLGGDRQYQQSLRRGAAPL